MRKLKKLLAAVLAGTMVITSLTGCGGSGYSSKGPLTIEQIKKNGKLLLRQKQLMSLLSTLTKTVKPSSVTMRICLRKSVMTSV